MSKLFNWRGIKKGDTVKRKDTGEIGTVVAIERRANDDNFEHRVEFDVRVKGDKWLHEWIATNCEKVEEAASKALNTDTNN